MSSYNLNFKRSNKSKKEELDRLIKKVDMGLDHSWSARMIDASTNVGLGHIGSGSFSEPVSEFGPIPHTIIIDPKPVTLLVGQSIGSNFINQTQSKATLILRVKTRSRSYAIPGLVSELRWGGKHSDRLAGWF